MTRIARIDFGGRTSLAVTALLAAVCLLACGGKKEEKAGADPAAGPSGAKAGDVAGGSADGLPRGAVSVDTVSHFGAKADWGTLSKTAPEVDTTAATDVPTRKDPSSVSKAGIPAPISGFSSVHPTGFRVAYAPSQQYDQFRRAFQEEQVFEKIAAMLNQTIALDRVVDIQLVDCGTVNAFYDPNNSRIIICYELLGYYTQMFAPVAKDQTELGKAIIGATLFAFFHELGHGLIHQLHIPAVGREEDAVDQLATLILMEGGDDGVAAALAGAQWFALESAKKQKEGHQMPFWDEHALDQQRFFNIACMIYGSDPQKYQPMVQNGYLPEKRAVRCQEEHHKLAGAWDALLEPHLREGVAAGGPAATVSAPAGGPPAGAPTGGTPAGTPPTRPSGQPAGGGWSAPTTNQAGGESAGGWGAGTTSGREQAGDDSCQAVANHVSKLITEFVRQQAASMPPAQKQQVEQELAAQLPVYLQSILQMCTQQNWSPAVRKCVLQAKDAQTADKCTLK